MPTNPNDYPTPPLQLRRGTLAKVLDYYSAEGELTYSTDTRQLFVGDGISLGGLEVLTANTTATSTASGVVKVGTGLNVDGNGFLNLNTATTSTIGGVIVGSGLTVDQYGVLTATGGGGGDFSTLTNQKLFTTSSVVFAQVDATTASFVVGIFSGDVSAANVYVPGYINSGTLVQPNVASNYNLLVGTTSTPSGSNNIILGYGAGKNQGGGSYPYIKDRNVIIGVDAMETWAFSGEGTPSDNVAIGYQAGKGAVRNNSIFIGSSSGVGMTDVINSTIIGTGPGSGTLNTGVLLYAYDQERLRITSTSTFINALRNSTSTMVAYYNSSTKELSYGPAPVSGGGNAQSDQALYTTSSVTFANVTINNTGTANTIKANTITHNGSGGIDIPTNINVNQVVVGDGSNAAQIYSKGAHNLVLVPNDATAIGGRIQIVEGEANGVVIGNHNQTTILTVNTSGGVTVASTFPLVANTLTVNTIKTTSGSISMPTTLYTNELVVGNGSSFPQIFGRGAYNFVIGVDDVNKLGGQMTFNTGEASGVVIGNHHKTNILQINTSTGVKVEGYPLLATTATIDNVSVVNSLRTDNYQGQTSPNVIIFGDGTTTAILKSRGLQELRLTPEGEVGGRIAIQAGQTSGMTLGNHHQWNIVDITTSSVTINNTPLSASTASFGGNLTALSEFTVNGNAWFQAVDFNSTASVKNIIRDPADAFLTIGEQNYPFYTIFANTVTTDAIEMRGGGNLEIRSATNITGNLFVGNGGGDGNIFAQGSQRLVLSANGDTGNGAKIFLGNGESGSVQLGHFNNNSIMTVATATGVVVNTPFTFNTNGQANIQGGLNITSVTTSNNNINVIANAKIITTGTSGGVSSIEIWNQSGVGTDHNAIKFLRQRGTGTPNSNNILGAIQVDGWQTTNGFASSYAANKRFPGIDWIAAATYSANTAPTSVRLQNRVPYNAINPFPYNVTNANTTDTTVVENLVMTPTSTRIKGGSLAIYEPFQGWDLTSSLLVNPIHNSVFGTQRFGASVSNAGSLFSVNHSTAYSSSTAEMVGSPNQNIVFRTRTDNIPYWAQFSGALTTSTAGQINWYAADSTPASSVFGFSIVKGPTLSLNALRYQRGNYTVTRGTVTTSTTALWNTTTQAGDVLGSIAFQGALESQSIGTQVDGNVDGIIIRAYAVNNWQGQNASTTTEVTFTSNETALRIEHANTTTIGGVSNVAGLKQQYGVLAEFGKTTSTFNTVVNNKNTVLIKDTLYNANKITGIATTATQVVGSFVAAAYDAAKFAVKIVDGTSIHFAEISLITDGTDIWKVEYGINTSDGVLGTFDTNLNSGVVELRFTPTAATAMTIATAITALPKL